MTLKQSGGKSQQNATSLLELSKAYNFEANTKNCFSVKIGQSRLYIGFQKIFTGFYNKNTCRSCFQAIHEILVLRNYNVSVSGRQIRLYYCSIHEVYSSIETENLYKRGICNFVT